MPKYYTARKEGKPEPLPSFLAEWLTGANAATSASGTPSAAPVPAVPIARLREALLHVDADDRAQWVNIGQALKHGYGEAGYAVWLEWSRTSAKYNEGDEDKWHTFDKNRDGRALITTRSIMSIARKNGYQPPVTEFSAASGVEVTAYELGDFLGRKFKPREMLLDPVIATQSLSMIYGARGSGKTRFTVTLAIAAASGGTAFGWKAARRVKTLYLDGEMAGADIQALFSALGATAPKGWDGADLRIVTSDAQQGGIPDLCTLEGQQAIDAIINDAELIVIDNLSAWVRGTGEENSAESWTQMRGWLMQLRAKGLSVVLVHHAGKSGAQRGTSSREDALDLVIALKRPPDYVAEQGARFQVHFEKARGLHGTAVATFETQYSVDTNGVPTWDTRTMSSHATQILALHKENIKPAQIARELGLARSTVYRAIGKHTMPPVEGK